MSTRLRARSGTYRGALITLIGAVLATGAPSAAAADPESYGHGHDRQPVIGQPNMDHGCAKIEKSLPTLSDWPKVDSKMDRNFWDEWRINQIVNGMSLAEKVG